MRCGSSSGGPFDIGSKDMEHGIDRLKVLLWGAKEEWQMKHQRNLLSW